MCNSQCRENSFRREMPVSSQRPAELHAHGGSDRHGEAGERVDDVDTHGGNRDRRAVNAGEELTCGCAKSQCESGCARVKSFHCFSI
jgi:hypothetical protein